MSPDARRRVIHRDGRRGAQLEDDGYGNLLIKWGAANGVPVTEWISCHDVITDPEPIYYGTEREKNRSLLYNPMDHLR